MDNVKVDSIESQGGELVELGPEFDGLPEPSRLRLGGEMEDSLNKNKTGKQKQAG